MKPLPLRGWVSGLAGALAGVVCRFPLVTLAAVATAASSIWLIHHDRDSAGDSFQSVLRILLLAVAAMPWLFAFAACGEKKARRFVFNGFALAGLAVFWLLLPGKISGQPGAFWFSYFGMLASIHFLVAVLPWPERNSEGFWPWNRALFTRFLESGLYAFILWLGLELALVSLDHLFSLKVNEKYYPDLFIFCAAIFHPLFFLAGILPVPSYRDDRSFPKILKIFTQVVLAPLCAIYAAILYAYAVKILVVHRWPDGWVTAPVLAFSVAGILAWLLLQPLAQWDNDRWGRWFCTNLPRILIPLCILMLLAMRVRIREYGYTEIRVLGVAAGFWLLVYSIFFTATRSRDLRLVPASLALVGVLLSLGPYSAPAIALRSQTAELEKMLAQIPSAKPGLRDNVADTIRYIVNSHGLSALPQPILDRWKSWRDRERKGQLPTDPVGVIGVWNISDEMCQALGLGGGSVPSRHENDCVCVSLSGTKPVALHGAFELYANLSLSCPGTSENAGPFIFTIDGNGRLAGKISMTGAPLDVAAVNTMISAIAPPDTVPAGSHDSTQDPEKLSASFLSSGETFRLVITHATGHRTGPQGHRWLALDSLDFLVIREKPAAP